MQASTRLENRAIGWSPKEVDHLLRVLFNIVPFRQRTIDPHHRLTNPPKSGDAL